MSDHILCHVEEIGDPGAKGFTIETAGERRAVFVVRRLGHVFAYENTCPHVGTPLDFVPDRFLSHDRRHLLCSTHGALFEIVTGLCVHGPCKGRSLKSLAAAVHNGKVVLANG